MYYRELYVHVHTQSEDGRARARGPDLRQMTCPSDFDDSDSDSDSGRAREFSDSIARASRARRARAGPRAEANQRMRQINERLADLIRTHEPLVSSRARCTPHLGTGSRIPDPAMKLVGIPGVSRTCTSHRPCANWKLSAVLLIV